MDNKRFALSDLHEIIDCGNVMTVYEVVNTMNELYYENDKLKQENKELKDNFDYLLEMTNDIVNRNLMLWEKIGKYQRKKV